VRNPFFAELVVGVEEWCRQAGYSVFLCNSDNDPKHQQSYLRTLLEKRIDGLLLSSAGDTDALATTFRHASVPVVTVDRLVPGARADRVSVNNQAGAMAAVRHLISLGHRRIGCVSGPAEFEVTQERVAGWRAALHDAGLEPDDIWLIESDFSTAGGYEAVKTLLARAPDITAVFTSNDLMAMGALRAAAESGRSVPQQLSVVGFDGIELGSYIYPAITSVGCSIRDLGREAGRALIERIENPQAPFKDLQLTPQLVLRESTSAPLSSEQA
jgi:LacI family transcriptional regulator